MTQFRNNLDSTRTPITTSSTTSPASSITSSSSSTSRYTQPGVSCTRADLEIIKDAYRNCIGNSITAPIAHYHELLFEEGMQPEVVLQAIQETAWARRPSPQYMRAILARYRSRGIKTLDQLEHDRDEWEREHQWWED